MAIKYKWLAQTLKETIRKQMKEGKEKLPSENELCKKYQVSRQTVRQALLLLENEHLIEKRQGSGSYITGLSSSSERNLIGVLVANDQDYMYPALLNQIKKVLTQNGYSVTIFQTNQQITKEREVLKEILSHNYRGLIVEAIRSAIPNPNLDLYEQLSDSGCTILFCGDAYPGLPHSLYVKSSNYSASVSLTKKLCALHHTKIGGIFLTDSLEGQERYLGFMETINREGLSIKDDCICHLTVEDLQDIRALGRSHKLKKYLSSAASNTAIICHSSEIAYALCKEMALFPNNNMSSITFASFDTNYLNHYQQKKFLTLSEDKKKQGALVSEMMIRKQKGLPVHAQEIPLHLTVSSF